MDQSWPVRCLLIAGLVGCGATADTSAPQSQQTSPSSGSAQASASATVSSPKGEPLELGVVTTSSVVLADSIEAKAAIDPAYKTTAIKLASIWLNAAEHGAPVMLAQSPGATETPLSEEDAQQLLTALQNGSTPPVQAIAPTGSAQPQEVVPRLVEL